MHNATKTMRPTEMATPSPTLMPSTDAFKAPAATKNANAPMRPNHEPMRRFTGGGPHRTPAHSAREGATAQARSTLQNDERRAAVPHQS